jgi:voltage-gated potassium channel
MTRILRRSWHFLKRENLHRLFAFVGICVGASASVIVLLEPSWSFLDGLWWSLVTVTTVGYGDLSPITLGGRIVALLTMFLGIGLLGTFSATIASVMVDRKIKAYKGMDSYRFENHIILCEWNERTAAVLHSLRLDPQATSTPIVLIADIEEKPVPDEELYLVRGNVTEDNLNRAHLAAAQTVVIVGDERLEPTARDAKAVLTTLAVETINLTAYTVVELADEANVRHCQRANADEIIVTSELSSNLVARAALDHGISEVISEVLRSDQGNQLYRIPVPASLKGSSFMDAYTDLKRLHQSTVVGVRMHNDQVITNPPADYTLKEGDYLIIISLERPRL